jgi:hypothetical protein
VVHLAEIVLASVSLVLGWIGGYVTSWWFARNGRRDLRDELAAHYDRLLQDQERRHEELRRDFDERQQRFVQEVVEKRQYGDLRPVTGTDGRTEALHGKDAGGKDIVIQVPMTVALSAEDSGHVDESARITIRGNPVLGDPFDSGSPPITVQGNVKLDDSRDEV